MIDLFTKWIEANQDFIESACMELNLELPDEPEELIQSLSKVEVHNGRIGTMLAEANAWLDKAERFYLPERKEGTTELDRQVFLKDAVADIRKVRDILESLANSIKQRLILGESVLSYRRQFLERSRTVGEIMEGNR